MNNTYKATKINVTSVEWWGVWREDPTTVFKTLTFNNYWCLDLTHWYIKGSCWFVNDRTMGPYKHESYKCSVLMLSTKTLGPRLSIDIRNFFNDWTLRICLNCLKNEYYPRKTIKETRLTSLKVINTAQ